MCTGIKVNSTISGVLNGNLPFKHLHFITVALRKSGYHQDSCHCVLLNDLSAPTCPGT